MTSKALRKNLRKLWHRKETLIVVKARYRSAHKREPMLEKRKKKIDWEKRNMVSKQ